MLLLIHHIYFGKWVKKKEHIHLSIIKKKDTSNINYICYRVPASQHPEIAPAEFEKYVDTHGLTIRKKSIKRRQSVLSVYFTANDQQKLLEELAERDSHSDLDVLAESDENEDRKRKLVLRRSVSLHLPTAGGIIKKIGLYLYFYTYIYIFVCIKVMLVMYQIC